MIDLDAQQSAAVHSDSRQVLCLAGAGSGKTRVLVERIAHLIEHEKVSPYEILACSFTRKSSQELRKRLEERVGKAAHHIMMGTIHSIALRYLKRFGEIVGLKGKNLTVYGDFEEQFLLKECAIDLGIFKKSWNPPKREIDSILARYYQEGSEPDADPPTPMEGLFREFIGRAKEDNAVTYGGILLGFRLLIPLIKNYLHLQHIFVDEIQDVDSLQWQCFNLLKEVCDASLFVVGDLSQSIYQWRGACPEYLIDHSGEFEIFKIQNNYRSLREIVQAANRLIKNNGSMMSLEMIPVRTS